MSDSDMHRLYEEARVPAGQRITRKQMRAQTKFYKATREWVPDALARLQQVRALHAPTIVDTKDVLIFWRENPPLTAICKECMQPWPCPTIRAIDEGA